MSGETETPKVAKRWKRILGKVFKIFMITVLLILLMGFIGVTVPVEIAFHLIVGPFIHAWKNLPPFLVQWRSSLLPLACLVVAVVLAHRFIRWWITSKNISMSWRWGHTAAATLLILLGSAAAIAMSGITHQAAWLFSSPWLENRSRRGYHVAAVSNARQIMLALIEYESEHGRYPDTLDEAAKFSKLPSQMLWVKTGPDGLREPFIFLKPGRPSSGLIEPILVSPSFQTDDRVVVGISDCSVKTMTLKALHKLTEKPQTAHE